MTSKVIDFVLVWQGLGDTFPVIAPSYPLHDLRAFFLYSEITEHLVSIEPGREGYEGNIHDAKILPF